VYHDGAAIVCLDLADGKPRWTSARIARADTIFQSTGVTLVLYDELVLFTGDNGKITVLNAADGRQVWAGKHPTSGHYCPQDLLVAGGLVWGGPANHNRGPITGKDPRTGEARLEIPCEQESYWFHQRCYRSRATFPLHASCPRHTYSSPSW
jgi:outer membrane protein assembly factor BamB